MGKAHKTASIAMARFFLSVGNYRAALREIAMYCWDTPHLYYIAGGFLAGGGVVLALSWFVLAEVLFAIGIGLFFAKAIHANWDKETRKEIAVICCGLGLLMIVGEVVFIEWSRRRNPPVPELHGVIIPAEEQTPANACGTEFTEKRVVLLLGGYASVGVFQDQIPIKMGERDLMTMYRSEAGIEISTRVISSDNKVVGQLTRNELFLNPDNAFHLERKDWHTLQVVDQSGAEVFYVHYYNRSAIRIRGRFYVPGCPESLVITNDSFGPFGGGRNCAVGFRIGVKIPCS